MTGHFLKNWEKWPVIFQVRIEYKQFWHLVLILNFDLKNDRSFFSIITTIRTRCQNSLYSILTWKMTGHFSQFFLKWPVIFLNYYFHQDKVPDLFIGLSWYSILTWRMTGHFAQLLLPSGQGARIVYTQFWPEKWLVIFLNRYHKL